MKGHLIVADISKEYLGTLVEIATASQLRFREIPGVEIMSAA